ncbi:MAG: hypothetical protein ACR5LD_09285 [Symbiopectobacterium sp.]
MADAVALLFADENLSKDEMNLLIELSSEQDCEPPLKAVNSDTADRQAERQELIAMLMGIHGTSRVLFRNTRKA